MERQSSYHNEIDPGLDAHHQHHSHSLSRSPHEHEHTLPPGTVEHLISQVAAVDDTADVDQQRKAAAILTAAIQTGKHFETPLGTLGHEQILHLLSQLPSAVSRQQAEAAASQAQAALDGAPPLPPGGHPLSGPSSGPPMTPGNDRSSPDLQSPDSGDKGKNKPAQGTEEWSRQRKDNHKEVERRRRGNINDGIMELARIVPNGEKNKGAVLSRAVSYIHQLKENEARNIEKWTLEKLLMDQAMGDLQAQLEEIRKRWEASAHRVEELERMLGERGGDPEEAEVEAETSTGGQGQKRRWREEDEDEDEDEGEGPDKRQRVQ